MAVHFQLFDTAAAYDMVPTARVLAAHFVNICIMTVLLAAFSFGMLLVLSALTLELNLLGVSLKGTKTMKERG
ncbi:hypothetical protein CEP52_001823 [Fusarium oligoseptatum]|uniref:Uncharacterized protein n=1 Tax=Fusarium oligoseptatum TaxID=2604345 RepID=A0A428UH94_9HYPO|nr:hypothetical protein CEP52_001823 [Fusarium oligoseptatum]